MGRLGGAEMWGWLDRAVCRTTPSRSRYIRRTPSIGRSPQNQGQERCRLTARLQGNVQFPAPNRSVNCTIPMQRAESTASATQWPYSAMSRHGYGVGDTVGEGVGVGDTLGEGVGVGDTVGEGVGVGDTLGEGVGVGDTLGEGLGVAVALGPGDGAGVGAVLRDGKGCVGTPGDDVVRPILKALGVAAGPTGSGASSELSGCGVAMPRTVRPRTSGSAGSLATACPPVRRRTPVAPIPIPLTRPLRTQSLWRRRLSTGRNLMTAGTALSTIDSTAGGR